MSRPFYSSEIDIGFEECKLQQCFPFRMAFTINWHDVRKHVSPDPNLSDNKYLYPEESISHDVIENKV